jgi:hypothetical protein
MADQQLERLKQDLHTIEAATGLSFPYGSAHVRTAFVMASSALVAAAFAWIARDLLLGWRVAAEITLVFAPVAFYAHMRRVPALGSVRQAREVSGFTLVYLVVATGSIALVAWLVRSDAITGDHALVIVGAICGAYFLTGAAMDKRLRSWYVAAVGAVLVPIIYLVTALPLDLLCALSLAIMSFVGALTWRAQLRKLGRWPA